MAVKQPNSCSTALGHLGMGLRMEMWAADQRFPSSVFILIWERIVLLPDFWWNNLQIWGSCRWSRATYPIVNKKSSSNSCFVLFMYWFFEIRSYWFFSRRNLIKPKKFETEWCNKIEMKSFGKLYFMKLPIGLCIFFYLFPFDLLISFYTYVGGV